MKRVRLLYLIGILLIGLLSILEGAVIDNINPYSEAIGNSAVDRSENIYSINPASIGLVDSSMLYQNFALNKNQQNILFSENILLKLSGMHSLMLGYSMMDKNKISLENSKFNINYALNLGNFLYVGANFGYTSDKYIKFNKNNLKSDIGAIINLEIDDFIKFINFGIYGLDANLEKISLEFPNANYGKNSFLGFGLGLVFNPSLTGIFSVDANLVKDGKVLGPKEKSYKYGAQFNIGGNTPWLSLKGSAEFYKNDAVAYSSAVKLGLHYFDLNYGIYYNKEEKVKNQYLSVSFAISYDKKENKENVGTNPRIKMSYYEDNGKYKIIFKGDLQDIVYWKLYIMSEDGDIVKEIKSNDDMPEYIVWDGKDKNNKEVKKGIYEVNLVYIRNNLLLTLYDEHKKIYKGILF